MALRVASRTRNLSGGCGADSGEEVLPRAAPGALARELTRRRWTREIWKWQEVGVTVLF